MDANTDFRNVELALDNTELQLQIALSRKVTEKETKSFGLHSVRIDNSPEDGYEAYDLI